MGSALVRWALSRSAWHAWLPGLEGHRHPATLWACRACANLCVWMLAGFGRPARLKLHSSVCLFQFSGLPSLPAHCAGPAGMTHLLPICVKLDVLFFCCCAAKPACRQLTTAGKCVQCAGDTLPIGCRHASLSGLLSMPPCWADRQRKWLPPGWRQLAGWPSHGGECCSGRGCTGGITACSDGGCMLDAWWCSVVHKRSY